MSNTTQKNAKGWVRLPKKTRERSASAQELAVLKLMTDKPEKWWYGYELKKCLKNVEHPTIYNILLRLNRAKRLDSEWVIGNPEIGEKPRHQYKLNHAGIAYAANELYNALKEKREEVEEILKVPK